ncbi:MAG TPA: xanthine dehydrogenase family protein subunit M [Methylomirabilota bacterium]|nr:xanthine dehydrogenase family protein subunit M [Methylomirabilota bacterium]
MMRSEIDVLSPHTLDDALTLLQQYQNDIRIVAGGSDIIIQLRDGVVKTEKLLNILSLKDLKFIEEKDNRLHIGSLSTYTEIINSQQIKRHAWILRDAAKQIGAVQLQNTATIGGNLGNASPAADSLPPLYALGATVVTRSIGGRREIPIEKFFSGYRKTTLKPDELIEEIYFDRLNSNDAAAYLKLGLRKANAISIVDVAVALRQKVRNSYNHVNVALGAVAPTIVRAHSCEQALIGKNLTDTSLKEAAKLASQDISPITDIRGSAEYRRRVVSSLVYQALHSAILGSQRHE